MKNKRLYFLLIFVFPFSFHGAYAQTEVYAAPGYGAYIYNSENGTSIMGDKDFRYFFSPLLGIGIGNILGYQSFIEYSYQNSLAENTIAVPIVLEGPYRTPLVYSNVDLRIHNIDLSLRGNITDNLTFGIGPAFSIINRSIIFPVWSSELPYDFLDRLISYALGLHASINFQIPLSDGPNRFLILSSFKARYTHTVLYDKGGRDLSNYNQDYLTGFFFVGLGYQF
jgi:hypothetical protein